MGYDLDLPGSLNNNNCYDCGMELTKENASMWESFVMVNGSQFSVRRCLLCDDIQNRMSVGAFLSGSKEHKEYMEALSKGLIVKKTREQFITEQKEAGVTMETLYQKQVEFQKQYEREEKEEKERLEKYRATIN